MAGWKGEREPGRDTVPTPSQPVTDELPPADLLSLISLAGSAIDRRVLEDLHATGFGSIRPAHGYLIQRLLTGPQLVTVMAADLGVSQQAVSKMAKELVRLGVA